MRTPPHARWFFGFAATTVLCWAVLVCTNIIVDPLHYFRLESAANKRWLENERWAMPAAARHFPADVVLLGTSRVQNENAGTIQKAFGKTGLRLSIAGGTPYELAALTRLYLAHNAPGVVLVELSSFALHPGDTHREAAFPHWLYEDNALTGLHYALSPEVFEFSLKIVNGRGKDDFGEVGRWYETYTTAPAPFKRTRLPCHMITQSFSPDDTQQAVIEAQAQSVAANFVPLLSMHKKTKFVFFFPPFNLSQYDSAERLQWVFVQERIMALLGGHANARIVDFSLMHGVVMDDNLYRDPEHYLPETGALVLGRLAFAVRHPAQSPPEQNRVESRLQALKAYHGCPKT